MKNIKIYIAVIFSVFVVGYVLMTIDWKQAWEIFQGVQYIWLILALLFHLGTYVIRTLRFRFLLDSNPGFLSIWGATNLYGMYLYLLPVKTGEVTLPILYKDHLEIPMTQSAAALIAARFLDLVIMALLLPVLLFMQLPRVVPYFKLIVISISLVVALCWAILIYFLRNPEKLEPFIKWFAESRFSVLQRLGELGDRVFQGIITIYLQRKLWRALLISAGIWLLVQNTLYSIISSLNVEVTLLQVVVVSLVMIPFTFVPLQGFANLGTYEISIVLAFSLYGVQAADSLNIAVGSHIIYILFSFLLGLSGLALSNISKLKANTKE